MTYKEQLLDSLHYYQLPVLWEKGNTVGTIHGFSIEVENHGVFKLLEATTVIAPFSDLEELCNFILATP